MLQEAALGIALIQGEGAAVQTLQSADVICTSITHALGLLLFPKRLIATLGFDVVVAESGERALETYRERGSEIDVVLMAKGHLLLVSPWKIR